MDYSEQQLQRQVKRESLIGQGTNPYPVAGQGFITHSLEQVRQLGDQFTPEPDFFSGVQVVVAARIVFLRHSGGISFARLRSGSTELQVMFSRSELGVDNFKNIKRDLDLGDFLRVEGEVVYSRTQELSVLARSWSIAVKALRPPPFEFGDLSEENRVRRRWLDLLQNAEARDMIHLRASVLKSIRRTLDDAGYIEAETPMLQLTNGGASARPFGTHLNAFDQDMNLRIALEVPLKKLLVGGIDRVYEVGRVMRNEGVDSSHSPEFTSAEWYEAFGDVTTQKTMIQRIIESAAVDSGHTIVQLNDEQIDLNGGVGWPSFSLCSLVSDRVHSEVNLDTPEGVLRSIASEYGVAIDPDWTTDQILVEMYEQLVEPNLIQPTFVEDFPASVRPLARPRDDDSRYALAADLIINGTELGCCYTELNDPVLQRERLQAQAIEAAHGDPEAMELDESFIEALEQGMTPAGGSGMGVDRLIMLLSGTGIRDTIAFPVLRAEQ